MHHLGAEYFGAEDLPLQFKFKTPFGSLSTPELGEETSVSSALRPPALLSSFRCHSPPLWHPSRSPGVTDKRLALRSSSPPVWKPVPFSEPHTLRRVTSPVWSPVSSPRVPRTRKLKLMDTWQVCLGREARTPRTPTQSSVRFQLAPNRPVFQGTMGQLPRVPRVKFKLLGCLKFSLTHSSTMSLNKLCGPRTLCYSLHMQKQLSMACKQVFQGRLMPRTRRGGDSGNNTFTTLGATLLNCGSLT